MFMPKETKFFDLFDKQAEIIIEAATLFNKIISNGEINKDSVDRMHEIEHRADELTHNIMNTVNESFITPFDREDIVLLAGKLDDIVDGMYLLVNRFHLYKITTPSEESKKLASIIEQSSKALQKVIASLRSNKNMKETLRQCIEINRLENVADEIRDNAISRILNDETANPLQVIKQKELFEEAEAVTDYCEQVANVIESILVKNN